LIPLFALFYYCPGPINRANNGRCDNGASDGIMVARGDQQRKELEKKSAVIIPEKTLKMLEGLWSLLNKLAKDEIDLTKGMRNTNDDVKLQ